MYVYFDWKFDIHLSTFRIILPMKRNMITLNKFYDPWAGLINSRFEFSDKNLRNSRFYFKNLNYPSFIQYLNFSPRKNRRSKSDTNVNTLKKKFNYFYQIQYHFNVETLIMLMSEEWKSELNEECWMFMYTSIVL